MDLELRIPEGLLELFQCHSARLSSEGAQNFIAFVQRHPKLFYKEQEFLLQPLEKDLIAKNVSSVSSDGKGDDISEQVPQGRKMVVYDVKIKCRGPDDKIYLSPNTIDRDNFRKWITRGCSLVHNVLEDEWFLFQGFAKFSGITNEDDDDLAQAKDDHDMDKQLLLQGKSNAYNSVNDSNNQVRNQDTTRANDLNEAQEANKLHEPQEPRGLVFRTEFEIENKCDIPSDSNSNFFDGKLSDASQIVQVDKLNGKAAHFGVMKCGGERVIFAGSKNVHITFRNHEDIRKIPESNKMLHCKIGHLILDLLDTLENKEILLEALEQSGLLMNFELLLSDEQHVVDYNLSNDELRFLAFTPRTYDNDEYINRIGKCLPVLDSIEWIQSLSIRTATTHNETYSMENLLKMVQKTRETLCNEGCVFYFLNSDKKTIGLWKVKSFWYIILRAIREKVVNMYKDFNFRVQHRLRQLKQLLQYSDNEYKNWCILADSLHKFVKSQVKCGKVEENSQIIRDRFAALYSEFLKTFTYPEDTQRAFEAITLTDDDPLSIAKDCKKRRQPNTYRKHKRQRR